MYKQNGCIWLPWLQTSDETVVKQFVQWSVTTTSAHTTTKLEHMWGSPHIILPQQNWNTCEGVPMQVYQSCSNYEESISVMAVGDHNRWWGWDQRSMLYLGHFPSFLPSAFCRTLMQPPTLTSPNFVYNQGNQVCAMLQWSYIKYPPVHFLYTLAYISTVQCTWEKVWGWDSWVFIYCSGRWEAHGSCCAWL